MSKQKGSGDLILVVIVLIVLFFMWLLAGGNTKKENEPFLKANDGQVVPNEVY
ncbi:MAG: hypothetical protein U9R00_02690 [Patescibacteria group bacterium]|nr:hypothetical protein [Patescibacteria group bacterium]